MARGRGVQSQYCISYEEASDSETSSWTLFVISILAHATLSTTTSTSTPWCEALSCLPRSRNARYYTIPISRRSRTMRVLIPCPFAGIELAAIGVSGRTLPFELRPVPPSPSTPHDNQIVLGGGFLFWFVIANGKPCRCTRAAAHFSRYFLTIGNQVVLSVPI